MATVLNHSQPLNTSTTDAVSYTRLHITPLDESLLGIVVPSSVLPRARNISYHTIKTFPEKRYGFVDLPTADADKIKNKLNGALLRGAKMRIEKAKPESIPEPTGEAGGTEVKKEKKKSKKRKREVDVTPGVELENRKVKRGWTTSEREMIHEKRNKPKKDKKSKDDKEGKKKKKRDVKSKYTDGPECLFKIKLPDASSSSKTSEDVAGHKKKKRNSDREVVLHEFEKTVKHPSFLKSNVEKSTSEAVTFKDGVGWVNEDGIVVEPVVSKRSRNNTSKTPKSAPSPEEDDDTSSSGSSSDESDEEVSDQGAESSDEEEAKMKAPPKSLRVETQPLSSPVSILKTESARPKSASSVTSLTIKIPPTTPAAAKVHPLEALYKRPKGATATPGGATKEAQPFSFFDGDDGDDDDIEEENTMAPPSQPPMTPFTKQDFEFRNLRSAAPTPDTAHPSSRTFNLWPRQGSADDRAEDEEEDGDGDGDDGFDGFGNDEDDDTVMAGAGVNDRSTTADDDKQAPISDFQKQFWESRGDLNRSWRKRRKAASKEKRYRDNRARAERAI
ncbi:hypothetical protein F4781DRAFT_356939 [Annulohypoxylon bovei var. microspora]|nr:hypothetical protein F4781DRAFT_356939 [Annulohypoxylon bovei var. microspora]